MAVYEFQCRSCGREYESPDISLHSHSTCNCGSPLRKLFRSVKIGGRLNGRFAFQPHYNYAVGSFVRTDREFRTKLSDAAKRQSDELEAEHTYTPVYPGDLPSPPPNVDSNAIESSLRTQHDLRAK